MTKHTLGDGPIEPQNFNVMNALAYGIDHALNPDRSEAPGAGFILLVMNFGNSGRCNYISNVDRESVVAMLKEQLAYFQGMPTTGSGKA